jgi:hypothetical protein
MTRSLKARIQKLEQRTGRAAREMTITARRSLICLIPQLPGEHAK